MRSYVFKPANGILGIQIVPLSESVKITGLSIYSKNTGPGYVSLLSGGNGAYAVNYFQEKGIMNGFRSVLTEFFPKVFIF